MSRFATGISLFFNVRVAVLTRLPQATLPRSSLIALRCPVSKLAVRIARQGVGKNDVRGLFFWCSGGPASTAAARAQAQAAQAQHDAPADGHGADKRHRPAQAVIGAQRADQRGVRPG